MKLNKLEDAKHWYRESLKAKPDHVPAHLTYGKLLSIMVSHHGNLLVLILKMYFSMSTNHKYFPEDIYFMEQM